MMAAGIETLVGAKLQTPMHLTPPGTRGTPDAVSVSVATAIKHFEIKKTRECV